MEEGFEVIESLELLGKGHNYTLYLSSHSSVVLS